MEEKHTPAEATHRDLINLFFALSPARKIEYMKSVFAHKADLLAKVSEQEIQLDNLIKENAHLAQFLELSDKLKKQVSEQEKEIEDIKKYPGPEWISFDDHRDKIHEQSKELTSLRSENEMLKEEVEQNNDVGKLANFLQQTIRNQRDEVEKLKEAYNSLDDIFHKELDNTQRQSEEISKLKAERQGLRNNIIDKCIYALHRADITAARPILNSIRRE